MSSPGDMEKAGRERLLDPVDRVSEILFGLFMALTFTGAVAVASDGKEELRTMFIAALGCNIAWGLVDGVMYIVQGVVARLRAYTLGLSVRGVEAQAGRKLMEDYLPPELAKLVSAAEIEAMRARLMAQASPERPTLQRDDLLGGLGIFFMCVIATFPVVLPFMFIADVGTAKNVSRGVALAMLFLGGLALGRYAGYGSFKAGVIMVFLGSALVVAIMALGG